MFDDHVRAYWVHNTATLFCACEGFRVTTRCFCLQRYREKHPMLPGQAARVVEARTEVIEKAKKKEVVAELPQGRSAQTGTPVEEKPSHKTLGDSALPGTLPPAKPVNDHRPKLTVQAVVDAACVYFNIKHGDLAGTGRSRALARPRQVAMFLAKTMTNSSLPQVGRKFGNRDHTTVLHAMRKVETLYHNRDPFVVAAVMGFRAHLQEKFPEPCESAGEGVAITTDYTTHATTAVVEERAPDG